MCYTFVAAAAGLVRPTAYRRARARLLVASRLQPRCAMSTATSSGTPAPTPTPTPAAGVDLVQYVVVRTDLDWPLGSVVAQGIHAALRATHPVADAHTAAYVAPDAKQQMTTVVLAAGSADVLLKTAAKLDGAAVPYSLWQEQPENVPTALASRPAPRATLKPLFKGLRLLR